MDKENRITTKEERDNYLQEMVAAREQGNFDTAVAGFQRVLEWDLGDAKNLKGAVDVLGHLSISFVNQSKAVRAADLETSTELLAKAVEVQRQGNLILAEAFPDDLGRQAIAVAHNVNLRIELMKLDPSIVAENPEYYEETLDLIEFVITNLPGTEAHKAWAYNIQAKVYLLKEENISQAEEAISKGEALIEADKNTENDPKGKESDLPDGKFKLAVWSTGLLLTKAEIAVHKNDLASARELLAKVLETQDPDSKGRMQTRHEQAQAMLDKLPK